MAQQAKVNGTADQSGVDELVLNQLDREPVTLNSLLERLHESRPALDDLQVKFAVWRLIDQGKLILNRERLIHRR